MSSFESMFSSMSLSGKQPTSSSESAAANESSSKSSSGKDEAIDDSPVPNYFTEEEILAFRQTRDLLLSRGLAPTKLSPRELFITVLNCKLRPEYAAEKYQKWLDALALFNINSFDEIWEGISRDGGEGDWSEIQRALRSYGGCGLDALSRGILWVRARTIEIEEERLTQKAGVIYFTAVHADMISLRKGITFVLDTSASEMTRRVGNEDKMQKGYQSIPLRPQRIYILGAGFFKRTVINALLSIASLFTKEKVISRIRFAEIDEVKEEVPLQSLPVYVGGGGGSGVDGKGGIESEEQLLLWVRQRLAAFPPIPEL